MAFPYSQAQLSVNPLHMKWRDINFFLYLFLLLISYWLPSVICHLTAFSPTFLGDGYCVHFIDEKTEIRE